MNAKASPQKRASYLIILNWPIWHTGGVNEVVLNLAQQLRMESSYESIIGIASWDSSEHTTAVVRGNEVIQLRIRVPYASRRGFRVFAAFLATLPVDLWKLARFLRERRVRVINTQFTGLNSYAFLLLKWLGLFRGKIILTFQGADMTGVGKTKGFHRRIWRYLITRVDGVVACSEALRRDVRAFAPKAKVVAIHNGVDLALFDRSRINRRERRSILHIGKFEHKKSQDVLLRAFQLLLGTIPDACLVLIGSVGPCLAQVQRMIADLGLEDRVEVHVDLPHEELPQFMDQADLFVLPSRSEPFGIVSLEAGAAGLPVVATRVGGIPELIEDGITGTLVPPDNVTELEHAIRDLLTDTAKADRLAQAWHETVTKKWSWRRMCEQYLELVESPGRIRLSKAPSKSCS